MRAQRLIVLLVIAAVASLGATPTQLASPIPQTTTISVLPGTEQPIGVASGNQTSPHVACNIASYTNDDFEGISTIKYFDFATGSQHTVPGNGLDRLSETDGQRIAFTQLDADGDHLLVYDIASQTTTAIPGNKNLFPVIGGNLIAFMHGPGFFTGSIDVQVYDQNTGNVTPLSNDALLNRLPAISPNGNVIVWEKCQTNGSACDIYSATQTGPGTFTTRLLTGAGDDHSPTTNGQVIAYVSDKGGEPDIYLQRAGGSTEMHLSIPGNQRDLRLSGDLLVFESETSPFSYDVFLYDLSSARLYQVTNTPDVSETLSDVVTGCNGLNRIVYAKPGPFGDFDVWGFTFQLDTSISDQLNDLIALVQSFNLHDGTEASLISKLQDALAAVNNSDTATACDSLTAFINAGLAQSGKKLTADQVKQLKDAATAIKTNLGCQ
jgi:hypothetical protein